MFGHKRHDSRCCGNHDESEREYFFFAKRLIGKPSQGGLQQEKGHEHNREHKPDVFPEEPQMFVKIERRVNHHPGKEEVEYKG